MEDPFYRYTMPQLIVSYEKHGTRIKNFKKVCSAIKRNEEYLIEYLKKNLGTKIKFDQETILINTVITVENLNDLLQDFIERYVLCTTCGLPETDIQILIKGEKSRLQYSCRACGATKRISNEDQLYKTLRKYPNRYIQKL